MIKPVLKEFKRAKACVPNAHWNAETHNQFLIRGGGPKWFVRYAFYAFLFLIPMEEAATTGYFSISKFVGLAMIPVVAIQPRLCFRFPPPVFFLLFLYVVAYLALGIGVITNPAMGHQFAGPMVVRFIQLVQMVGLFWISYNLFRYETVAKGAWVAVGAGSICLALLHLSGVSVKDIGQDRLASFGANPNVIATVLSMGMLALVGLTYGDKTSSKKVKLLLWIFAGVLAAAIISTGSRGPLVGLAAGLMTMGLAGKSLKKKLTLGVVACVLISGFVWASYNYEPVRVRWERSLAEGDLAGREEILPVAWEMVIERPVAGWGPVSHYHELGSRLGEGEKEAHNLYLWILLEVGLLGGLPFFAALWMCWLSAWRARSHALGILPLALLTALLVINMAGTGINRKLFWVVLAYAMAAGSGQFVRRAAARHVGARISLLPQQASFNSSPPPILPNGL